MSDVVTGEAVVLSVPVAQVPSRAAALLIDLTLQGLTLVGALIAVTSASFVLDPALGAALSIVVSVLVVVGYPVTIETLTRGRSVGKLALGLRVVGVDGSPERFRQALFRGLAGVLEFWMLSGAPALISALLSRRGQRLGDLFAGTMVINVRASRPAPPPPMPPVLAGWASTLELSQLPDEVANAARQYLTRFGSLSPQARDELGVRIAVQVGGYVAPPAPPGVPPQAYLAAVLAERRRRAAARLAARAAAGADARGPGGQGARTAVGASAPVPAGPASQDRDVVSRPRPDSPGGFVPPA